MTGVKRKGKVPRTETFTGSDCSGLDGETNRVLTLNNNLKTSEEIILVQGAFLYPSQDYNISHKSSNSEITFLGPIWNSQKILVKYFVPSPV